ncbi:c-type cytochrome [Ekhidna sp.]|uniref:c-type cytochrome n=1 Tax=Ekhidna sp. TaxID=2608089 RepID=UPI003B502D51
MKKSISSLIFCTTLFCAFILCQSTLMAQTSSQVVPWIAAPEADKLVNPIKDKEAALKLGKEIYTDECVVCHGTYGNAETNIAKTLEQKPKNFTKKDFMQQSDGAIFWKLSEGRGLMQPFKTMLTEEEIWSVVVYVKELAQNEN